jgi:histone-lysine N-methyltransferase SETD2
VGDGYCGYRVVTLHEGGNEDDYDLVKLNMSREIKQHRNLHEKVFAGKNRVDYILNVLVRSGKSTKRGVAPLENWLTFPDMGHVIATYYNRIVVELTSPIIGVSETFFPLRSSPPKDPSSRLLVLGLISNHFFYVKLKPGAPIYQRRQKREDNIVPMKLWNGSILLWIDRHILKR